MVGDAALREIVGADALIAHTGADLAAALGRDGGFDALLLDLIELGGQHLHTLFAVLHLTALLLTGHDDAGWLVDEAHGGAGLVDVLPACAGRTVDLHFDILGPDIDLGLLHFRQHRDRRGRRVDAPAGLCLRDALDTVDAGFKFEPRVRARALNFKIGLLHAAKLGFVVV